VTGTEGVHHDEGAPVETNRSAAAGIDAPSGSDRSTACGRSCWPTLCVAIHAACHAGQKHGVNPWLNATPQAAENSARQVPAHFRATINFLIGRHRPQLQPGSRPRQKRSSPGMWPLRANPPRCRTSPVSRRSRLASAANSHRCRREHDGVRAVQMRPNTLRDSPEPPRRIHQWRAAPVHHQSAPRFDVAQVAAAAAQPPAGVVASSSALRSVLPVSRISSGRANTSKSPTRLSRQTALGPCPCGRHRPPREWHTANCCRPGGKK